MPRLSASQRLGNTNTSALVRSAKSLAAQITVYQDDVQSLTYANSAYTDEAFKTYSDYLTDRINRLNATGSIIDATKAITLTKTLESATHSNVSASITRENIQILTGNATLKDKYNLIVSQFQRAMGIGDLTLAQTLEKQAYDVDQQIQYQAQEAANAAASLAEANARGGGARGGSSSSSSKVTYEGEVVSNLQEGLKYINSLARNTSEKELNTTLRAYAKQAAPTLNALGVNITGNQPNYFDVVYGITGAIYNAQVLRAQAEADINPLVSRTYATQAEQMLNGGAKFDTLAGKLSVQEIQQAQQDPNMFTYDNTKGTYIRDIQNGYQYMTFTDSTGKQTTQLVPKYSDFANSDPGRKAFNEVQFLTPQETSMMTKLGLNFTMNKSGTTGEGVQFSITENTPQWLKQILGEKGVGNMFTDNSGFVNFKGASSSGSGDSYYTVAMDGKGLSGLYEHMADGTTSLVGGDYGFAGQAIQMLINAGQQTQYKVQLAEQQRQEALRVEQARAAEQLRVQQEQMRAQQQAALRVAPVAPPARPATQAARLQPSVAPQLPTYNPQQTVSPQPPTFNPQQTVNGFNLNQSGSGGIRLR
jgi:hypothetical protein